MDTTLSAPIGQLLDGRYLVESQIARGGMATVYHARDVRLERIVALKIAHPELARDQEFVARFISEARAVARLSSPNVVAVFDQGSTGDLHYIAMEYVPGPTLRELLNSRGRLSPRESLDIIERVLAGLAAAHEAGIIHRDVKPENVLLGTGTSVKVADFGLARAAAGVSHTKTGLLIGTAAYLAPEQVASNSSDQRSDVYAAGVMLFEMLTGVQPHTGESPLAVAYKHVNSAVPAPSTVNPDLPAALDALVALGTSRDPDLRPPDARHYLKAITEVRRGMPVPPLPPRDAVNGSSGQPGFMPPATGPAVTGPLPVFGDKPAANHTMIVPAGDVEAEFADGGGYRARRRYAEPRLQRWLFSRRILIVIAVLLLAGLGWWFAEGQYTTVPSVRNLTVAAARTDLRDAGFDVVTAAARHSNTVPAGDVILTEPADGARLRHGGKITIVPSLGPVMITVPSVTGEPVAQAEQSLRAVGLTPGKPTGETSTSIPAGVVIATNPVAYQRWPANKPVGLIVSIGPPLPDFVGQQVGAAEAAAGTGGYSIQAEPIASSEPSGTVVKQSPQPGSQITANEVVTLWVSQGPPQVAVPDVDGLNAHAAELELVAAGFQVSVDQIGPGNHVYAYSPTGTAPKGSTITITVGFSF
jgi:eukaryotic-like serine/threonine-protein kinase